MTSDQSPRSLVPAIITGLTGVAGYAIAVLASNLARAITVPATLAAIERPPEWQGLVLLGVPLLVVAILVVAFIWQAQGQRVPHFRSILQAVEIGAATTTALGAAAYFIFKGRYGPLQSYFDQYPDDAGAQLAAALHASVWFTIGFGVALAAASVLARRFLLKAMTS